MAKRFVDTCLYEKPWFRKLSIKHKCLWEYIRLKCDNAGVLDFDEELASFQIGEKIKWEDLQELSDQISIIEDKKILLNNFISFQYGKLSEACKPHKQILELISKYKLDERVLIPFQKGYVTVQDKEKEKEKEKDVLILNKEENKYNLDFEEAWKLYPNKEKKKDAERSFKKTVKSKEDLQNLFTAIKNYLSSQRVASGFIKNGSTFFSDWQCWIDPTKEMLCGPQKGPSRESSLLSMHNPYSTKEI